MDALLGLPSCRWFRSLYAATNTDIDVALYLVKQATRSLAGLRFVELLILYGCKRSGKDTYVDALIDIFQVRSTENALGWHCVGPGHYFTAPSSTAKFEPEGHSSVTHEFDKLRLIVIPEIPTAPIHIRKDRLEGTSHARAGHAVAGDNQQVELNCLWLMHGNVDPRLYEPEDVAQADRCNPVHTPCQFGDLTNPDFLWDERCDPSLRRQEDPQIKEDVINGVFAAELFTHCKFARETLQNGARKIEPRPDSVVVATRALMVREPMDARVVSKEIVDLFCTQCLEERELCVECFVEVKHALKAFLDSRGLQIPAYPGRLFKYNTGNAAGNGVPRGTPPAFVMWNTPTRRGAAPCVKDARSGGWVRFGLNETGRQFAHTAMCAVAQIVHVAPPPQFLTNEELAACIEAGGGIDAYPARFREMEVEM